MQPERTEVALRARTGWEAVDLGFRMVRRWWRPIAAAWLLTVLPVAALIHFALQDQLWLALALTWWLKPLFDRVPLYVLSEAFFGHAPSLLDTARAVPGLLRSGVLRSLFWMRLTPMRAVGLPVLQLEGLRGRERGARTRLLLGREIGVALGLHVACLAFELAVFGALVELVEGFLPDELMPATRDSLVWEALGDQGGAWLVSAFYLITISVVEPFYVGGGFGFYINRRVYLEGWDIDLVFRRLARRIGDAPGPAGGGIAALLALVALVAGPAGAADEPLGCADRADDAAACIERILETDEFERAHAAEYWYPTWLGGDGDGGESDEEEESQPSSLLLALSELLARLGRMVVWVGLGVALAAIAFAALRRLGPTETKRPEEDAPAGEEREVRAERLPADPVGAARELWRSGDAAGAMSLLYRAAIAHLVDDCGLALPASATEGECARLARRHAGLALATDFADLVRAWQHCAYARLAPDDATFTDLCRRWSARTGVAP